MVAIDRAVTRVLRQKFQLGLFENPYVDAEAAAAAFDTPKHRALARRIAQQSIVLLKNDGGLLPLSKDIASIAVIGPCADSIRLLQGDYHFPTHVEVMFGAIPDEGEAQAGETPALASMAPGQEGRRKDLRAMFTPHVTPLAGIRTAVSPNTRVTAAGGCKIAGDDTSGVAEAVAIARNADVAVVCVGTKSGLVDGCTSGESSDRSSIELTAAQQQLVEAVAATGTPTVSC